MSASGGTDQDVPLNSDETMNESTRRTQRKYNRRMAGITAEPFPCLVREWQPDGVLFSVAMLIDDEHTADLLVDRWLCRNVSEVAAREKMKHWRR